MRYIKLFKVLCLLSAFVLLASCGGGTGGGASTGTSTITIAIGGTGQIAVIEQEEETLFAKLGDFIMPDEASAGTLPPPGPDLCFIPPDVHRVVFNITGLGMAPISREVIVGTQCPIIEKFEVPNGSQRIFSADEFNVNGAHLYTGATAQDIFGADHVQIIMRKADGCELYVDASNGNDSANDCRDANNRCSTITHALTQTDGFETICVAAGWYDDEDGNEIFPLQLKTGTRLLCQGPEHSSIIEPFNWDAAIIGAEGASVEGCRIVSGYPAVDDNESAMTINNNIIENTCIGINLYANSTVSNNVFQNMAANECQNEAVIAGGNGAFIDGNTLVNIGQGMSGIHVIANNIRITNNTITGNSDGIYISESVGTVINNNILSCNRADVITGYFSSGSVDVRNNQWDNVPPEISSNFYDGVDIMYYGTVDFLTDGASYAPNPCSIIPEPVCGDGNLDAGEECDDGNTFDGDGCSANCTLEPECADVSGAWTLFVSNITSTCGPEEPWSSDITIYQTGCTLEAVGIKGSTFPVSGSIVGNAGTLGPASFPEGFGTTTATYSGTLQPDGTITGNESWIWVGEGPSCSDGTADITLTRVVTPGDPCAGVVCDSGFTCIDGVCIEGAARNLVGPETGSCDGPGVGYTTVVDLGAGGLRVDVEFTNGPPNSSSTVYWVCTLVPGGCHGDACGYITLGTVTRDSNGQGFFSTILPNGNPYPGRYVHFDVLGGGTFTSITHQEIFPVPGGSATIAAAGMSMEVGIGDPTD